MTYSDQDVVQLTAMGFSIEQAREALTVSNGSMEAAVHYIFGSDTSGSVVGFPPATTTAAEAEPLPRVAAIAAKADSGLLQCSRSQYSVDQGRSACTCIALTAATKFLKDPNLTTAFLEEMITEGVLNYQELMHQQQQQHQQQSSSSDTIEHLSAEEVFQMDHSRRIFPLQNLGGIRQGVLSNDYHHPMGLISILEAVQQEQPPQEWMAVLITKTPESVLVIFPPPGATAGSSTSNSSSTSAYWLIDSHPRPQFGVNSAYAKMHPSLDSLWMSLQAIFPVTDLGLDIPEMMAEMYNSFEMYPLLLSR